MVAYGALLPITLSEMAKLFKNKQQPQYFLGRLLVGTLCTDAQVLEEVIVVSQLEAPRGSRSHIFLCNFATSTWSSQQARMWLPQGSLISIRNPCLSFAADGTACLEVLNPATLSIHGIAPPMVGGASGCLAQGQDSLQRGDFVRAAHLLGMAAADVRAPLSEQLTGSQRGAALAARCRAWLGAGLLDKALTDAIQAQKQPELLPDDRASAAASQAMALMGMQEFGAATACSVQASMGKCRTLLEQSQTGILDLESYYLGGEARESSPDVADFVGAVRIGLAPDGKGRGLFATRKVEAGEVLFVCNPLAALHREDVMPTEQDMVAEVVRSCLASRRNLEQLLSLVESSTTMVPNLDLFRPNRWLLLAAAAARTTDDVDLPACARRTSTNYGYKFERMVGRGRQRRREYLSGLWVLTAFANHSCSPSASQRAVGSASLVRAARELNDGDEVTLLYLDPLAPWEVRSKQTKSRWGFDCSCERCKAESSRAGTGRLKGLGAELDGLLQLLGEGDGEEEEEIDRLLVELSKVARSVEAEVSRWSSDKERQWTRASFYRAYEAELLVLHRRHRHGRSSSSCSWIQLMEALHFTAPGHEGLLATLLIFAKRAWDDGDQGGLELVHRACESCYGKLRTSVRTELLKHMEEELDID